MKIPLIRPWLPAKEKIWSYFQHSIDAGQFSNSGPVHEMAREKIKKLTTHNALVSNATVGIELALRAKFKAGARILIPSFTFKGTALAVINAGMKPVCTPVNASTWAIEPDPKGCDGMVVVAPFGHSIQFSDYENLGVPIVYDLAGAWGLHYKGPHLAIYSFHATKCLPIGEGGAVVSEDLDTIERISWLARFGHTNAKLSEIQCAILCAAIDRWSAEYTERVNCLGFVGTSSKLSSAFCSLRVASVKTSHIYDLTTNPIFTAKRYYFPLIEDLFRIETIGTTSPGHATRSTVAFPRDFSVAEAIIIHKEIKRILE